VTAVLDPTSKYIDPLSDDFWKEYENDHRPTDETEKPKGSDIISERFAGSSLEKIAHPRCHITRRSFADHADKEAIKGGRRSRKVARIKSQKRPAPEPRSLTPLEEIRLENGTLDLTKIKDCALTKAQAKRVKKLKKEQRRKGERIEHSMSMGDLLTESVEAVPETPSVPIGKLLNELGVQERRLVKQFMYGKPVFVLNTRICIFPAA
jgi:hypothetical protein